MKKRVSVISVSVLTAALAVSTAVYGAKPYGGGNYISGMDEVQADIESGDADVDEAVAELMDGFEFVYSGTYNEAENQEILLAFDYNNARGFVGITNPETSTLVWACMGDIEMYDDGSCKIVDTELGNEFEFTYNSETETELVIGFQGGELTLQKNNLQVLTDFFTTMMTGGFAQE